MSGSSIGELRIIQDSKIIFKKDSEEKKQIDEVKFIKDNIFCSTEANGTIKVIIESVFDCFLFHKDLIKFKQIFIFYLAMGHEAKGAAYFQIQRTRRGNNRFGNKHRLNFSFSNIVIKKKKFT